MIKDFSPNIPVGTVLSRPKGLTLHRGIYLGNGLVFESTWKWGSRLATFAQFAAKRRVRAEKVLETPPSEIFRRVKDSLGMPYNALTNNCNHAIARIEGGARPRSGLRGYALLALLVGAVLAAFAPSPRG